MKRYKLINNISGWTVFVIAAIVYLLTIESSASFWDCGEFISAAYKLEVGHPPGAPIFMLLGNLFSQFTNDPGQVALMINSMSALLSAFTILFLFWTITHLTRKLVVGEGKEELTLGQIIIVIGSGLVGSLIYTFSDTFWFSAVEGEVYAFSSMLTALVFWLILKWEDNSHKSDSDKWIVLIAYVMGLSIGVHLLNLLAIPAIVMVYYYKKNSNPNWKSGLLALVLSFGVIAVLMFGVIPGFTKIGGWFELFFVNTLGMSYNSGVIVYLVALVVALLWAILETLSEKGNLKRARIAFVLSIALTGILFIGSSVWLWAVLMGSTLYLVFRKDIVNIKFINLATSSLFVILIGFSAYALIPIRSSANPPLDLNSPEDVFSLGSYLNREQYGETPLIHGTTYTSQVERDAEGRAVTSGEKTSYSRVVKTSENQKDEYIATKSPKYKFTNTMLFPRMHSHPASPAYRGHMQGYENWANVDRNITPTLFDNLKFLVNYQMNFMYWRYFMWNFSGRQNDIQSDGGMTKGNWITGIGFIDEHVLGMGPQDNIAPEIADNKGRNKYYMLPLILGIIGIAYQLNLRKKGKQSFSIVFLLFFMTGLAIVLYLNQTPYEPRERDYAYAGSFYAFAIWTGIGVAGISRYLRKYIKNTTLTATVVSLIALIVPIQMASQNWDDHDRSGRTLARDTGMNYLSCVEPNAILFTNGDNDTYPLWYVQETEGFRTDVRVTNLSFMQTEWYVDQMLNQSYESTPLPIQWDRDKYSGDAGSIALILTKDEIVEVLQQNKIPSVSYSQYFDANEFKDNVSLKYVMENLRTGKYLPANPFNTDNVQIIPSNKLYLDVDTSKVDWKSLHSSPSDKMYIDLGDKSRVYRQELMIMDLLSNINDDNWKRPIYFATTVDRNLYLNLQNTNNFSLTGLAYQVVPGTPLSGGVNTEKAYDNLMNKFRWGGLEENPNLYLDETSRRMITTFRLYFNQLIEALINEGNNDKALAALDKATTVMPASAVEYGTDGIMFARAYYHIGANEKGEKLITEIEDRVKSNLDWYDRLSPKQLSSTLIDVFYNIQSLLTITSVYQDFDLDKYQSNSEELLERAQAYYMIGATQLGDEIVKEIANSSVRVFYRNSTDSIMKGNADSQLQQTLHMMQQFSPKLFEQYSRALQGE